MPSEEKIIIPCFLRPMPEFSSLGDKNKLRHGRYSKSIYQVSGYGKEKWAFSCYAVLQEAKISDYLDKGLSLKEIGIGCMNFLNKIPEREQFKKIKKDPLYGNLLEVAVCTAMPNDNILSIVFITDQKTNKLLWGEGIGRKDVE